MKIAITQLLITLFAKMIPKMPSICLNPILNTLNRSRREWVKDMEPLFMWNSHCFSEFNICEWFAGAYICNMLHCYLQRTSLFNFGCHERWTLAVGGWHLTGEYSVGILCPNSIVLDKCSLCSICGHRSPYDEQHWPEIHTFHL